MNPDIFKYATAVRDSVTKEQQAYIEEAYKKWSEDVLEQAEYYSKLTTGSSPVSQAYYQQLYKQMQAQSKEIANGVYTNITNGMAQVSDAVVKDAVDWMSGFGFSKKGLDEAFSYIPQSTVNSLITGSVYGKPGSWSLSAAIWGDNEKTLRDIYSIMSQGIAAQMPIEDIAKKLSQYVDPNKQLSWTGPNGMRIYKNAVDYNAQRLARTLVQHTYQQSFVAATKDNPFVTEYVWIANGSRVCPICADRDGAHFKKDKLPLDHPNGMCTMEPVVDDKMVDKLANWVDSEDGTYPEIDEFAKKFGYDASKMPKMTFDEIKKKYTYGIDSKTPSKWYKSLPKDVQDTVSQIHQESGLKWTQWYKKNIMDGGEDVTDDMLKAAVKSAKDDTKKAAKSFTNRNTADKALRKWLDDGWDALDDNQKFSVWKYTENSNPMNKPLSGYAHGSWSRRDFVGVGNADWGTEDEWRTLGSKFAKKFGKNGTSKVDHASAIADLTTAIDNYELEESMWLVRGSDTNGLAGMFEGAGFDFDDIKRIFDSTGDAYKQFEGMTIQNHAFTSTGIADDAGFGGSIQYKIYAPKGTRAIYAEPQSYYGNTISGEELYTVGHSKYGVGGEAEIILQRGTEFRITSIRKTGFGQYEIEMEVVYQPTYFNTGFEQTINNGLTSFK